MASEQSDRRACPEHQARRAGDRSRARGTRREAGGTRAEAVPRPLRPDLLRVPPGADGAEGYDTDEETRLAFHEDKGDGTALCGQPANDWTDPKTGIHYRGVWRRHGPGPVSCGKCANVSGEARGYESLAEPQGESVRTVSGGAFEMDRRRH